MTYNLRWFPGAWYKSRFCSWAIKLFPRLASTHFPRFDLLFHAGNATGPLKGFRALSVAQLLPGGLSEARLALPALFDFLNSEDHTLCPSCLSTPGWVQEIPGANDI